MIDDLIYKIQLLRGMLQIILTIQTDGKKISPKIPNTASPESQHDVCLSSSSGANELRSLPANLQPPISNSSNILDEIPD